MRRGAAVLQSAGSGAWTPSHIGLTRRPPTGELHLDIDAAWLAPLGALACLALGVLGLLAPMQAARLVGLTPVGRLGVSELRATYGGLFIGMGLACLALDSPAAYGVAGAAWLGAAVGRGVSMAIDRNASRANAGAVLLEGMIGALLASGLMVG
jgi:hypothetical protein